MLDWLDGPHGKDDTAALATDIRRQAMWTKPWQGMVSPELTTALERVAFLRRLHDREFLFQQGDTGQDLYGVNSGVVRLAYFDGQGHEALLGVYGKGTWFGEVPMFDGLPRPASAYAVGESEVFVATAQRVRALLSEHPAWYEDFARVISHKLRATLERNESTKLSIQVRVARGLLELVEGYGAPSAEGVRIALRLSQEDLARGVGLTRQVVNRGLRTLREAGLVQLDRDGVTVLDLEGLATAARFGSV